jgi:hypothetical protein
MINSQPTSELWKQIPEWPEYEVSSLGNVRRGLHAILTFCVHGYPAFNVSDFTRRKSFRVHRVVALLFIQQTGPVVRHLDGNKLNCCVSNLAWGTSKENEQDKVLHGTRMCGERHHQHRLTLDQVREIRASRDLGVVLARKYGVTPTTICSIRRVRSWKEAA